MMRKLFTILLSLCISLGMYAQNETQFKFSPLGDVSSPKTLRQENNRIEAKSLQEKQLKDREAKTNAIRERAEKGLPLTTPEKSPVMKAAAEDISDFQRLDSIVSTYPDGSLFTGQFLTYDENFNVISLRNAYWNDYSKTWETDTEITYGWNENRQALFEETLMPTWGEGSRKEFEYNQLGQQISYTFISYWGGVWTPMERYTYVYDDRGDMTELYGYMYDNGQWVPSSKELAEYDDLHRQIVYENYTYWGGIWEGIVRDEFEFDGLGNVVLQQSSSWDYATNDWQYGMKWVHEYNQESGVILLQMVAYWNSITQDWRGTEFEVTERTLFTYDDLDREISQVVSQLTSGSIEEGTWTEEGNMITEWSTLPSGETQSIRNSYDDDIMVGSPYQILTKRFNKRGQQTFEEEIQYGWSSHTKEEFTYNEDGYEIEYKSWGSLYGEPIDKLYAFSWQKYTRDEDNNVTVQENYGGQNTSEDDWVLNGKFEYAYENGYRTRTYSYYSYDGQLSPSWGWGIDLDFDFPASLLIQPVGAKSFQDRIYDHKITKTYNYEANGTEWAAQEYIRYYSQGAIVRASAEVGGNISPEGDVLTVFGSNLTFTFTPDDAYAVSAVLVDGENVPSAVETQSYTFVDIRADHTIEAQFGWADYTITSSIESNGTISLSGLIGVIKNGSKTFTFAPAQNYRIAQVLIDGVNNTTAVVKGSHTFKNVTENHTINVVFELITYTVTASAGNGGSISPDGETTVTIGESQTYTIEPNEGYKISKVLVDGVNNEAAVASGSYEFTDVQKNHNIKAEFEVATYTITATAGEGGSITPAGETIVIHGGSVYYAIEAGQGYQIKRVLVDGKEAYNGFISKLTYDFLNVTADHTIEVEYVNATAIDNIDNTFAVYPSPTTGPLKVRGLNADEMIYLYDITGTLVLQTTETSFDISHISSGIYLLKAGKNTMRIVKK